MAYDQWIDSDLDDDQEYDDTEYDNEPEVYCDVRPKRLF